MQTPTSPIRHFNRFELKYIVTLDAADVFKRRMGDYVVRDPHAGPGGGYGISSLYYDSDIFHAYWEKIEGIKFRRKVRVRRYDEDRTGNCFIEIKQRIDKTVQKRRTVADAEAAKQLMSDGSWDQDRFGRDPVFGEVSYLLKRYALKPAVVVSYQREPFMGLYDSSLRVTFDTQLRSRRATLAAWGRATDGKLFLPLDMTVVEVKFDNCVPLWLCRLLTSLEYVSQRMSKYCSAVCLYWRPEVMYENEPPELHAWRRD